MEEQSLLIQPNIVETTQPTPQKPQPHLQLIILILTFLLIASVTALVFIMTRSVSQQTSGITPSPTIAPPTPTPVRKLSSFATDSAFISFETTVASFSAVVSGYPLSDPSLNPPKLDLPLGFR